MDARLSRRLTLASGGWAWPWARGVAHLGDGPYVFGGLGLAYLTGWLWSNPWLRQAALADTLAVLLTMAIVTGLKFLIQRQRPHPPGEFVTFEYDKYSFPSGHSSRMAALAVGVNFFYPTLGLIFGLATLGVAASRMVVGVHYLSDILGGLLLGSLIAWGVTTILWPLF